MATIVERPVSALSDIQNSSRRTRRPSIEIIDVDSFDQAEGSNTQRQRSRPVPRPVQRRTWSQPDTINLVDSDDEVEFVPQILSGHNVDRSRSHRRFISPRPLVISSPSTPPPPVPPVPPPYAGHTSLPMRVRAPLHVPSPPVLPSAQGFTFNQPQQLPVAGPSSSRQTASALPAAPVSHHVPAMGFGGALISSNRAQAVQRSTARHARFAESTRRRPTLARGSGPLFPQWLFNEEDDEAPIVHLNFFLDNNNFDDFEYMRHHHHFTQRRAFKDSRENEQYRQSYTHPPQPEPGFTFDFAPEDEDVPRSRFFPPTSAAEPIILDDDDDLSSRLGARASSRAQEISSGAGQLNAVLVCAKCLDPLVLNAGLDPSEGQFKRVWGLRCGHIIDEKCLNELGQPPHQDEDIVVDRKGKGKAKAAAHKHTYGDAVPELQSLAEAEVPNIRSRLRSRGANLLASLTSSSGGPSAPPPMSASSESLFSLSPPTKKRRTNNKKPKVEGEFEWHCPVAHCGRTHVSVKIDGIWGPEKERDLKGVKGLQTEARGAVAIFA